jgi:hypothetical protein
MVRTPQLGQYSAMRGAGQLDEVGAGDQLQTTRRPARLGALRHMRGAGQLDEAGAGGDSQIDPAGPPGWRQRAGCQTASGTRISCAVRDPCS